METRKIEVELESRIETGPTQIGDDWPGVFIRGDNAVHYAVHLDEMLKNYPRCLSKHVIEQLAQLLRTGWTADDECKPSWVKTENGEES